MLVTGGSGFVGQSLVEALAGAGAAVRVLTRGTLPAGPVMADVERVAGDILDPRSLPAAMAGVAAVIHSAGARTGSAAELWQSNVTGTRLVAQATRKAGVPRFVHVSSASVYGSGQGAPFDEQSRLAPEDPYGCSKLGGEQAVKAELADSDVAWTIVRPYGIYGPRRLEFFREVQRRRLWLYGPSRALIHPTHVDDVVKVVLQALARAHEPGVRGETFNVAGQRAVEHFEYVQLVADRLGVKVARLRTPDWANKLLAAGLRVAPPPLSRLARPALVSRTADTSKSQRRLGFAPLPLEEGVDATIRAGRAARSL